MRYHIPIVLVTLFLLSSTNYYSQSESSKYLEAKKYSIGTNLGQLSTLIVSDLTSLDGVTRQKGEVFFRYYWHKKYAINSCLGLGKLSERYNRYRFNSEGGFIQAGILRHFSHYKTLSGQFGYNMGLSVYHIDYFQSFYQNYWEEAKTIKVSKDRAKIYHEFTSSGTLKMINKPKYNFFLELVFKIRVLSKWNYFENYDYVPGYGRYYDTFPIFPAAAVNLGIGF